MTTLLQCPNCLSPLPPPGSGHATCRFCGATSTTSIAHIPGSFGAAPPPPAGQAGVPPFAVDPLGAKALALDFKREHGADVTNDGQAMERLAKAWKMAVVELQNVKKTEINLPFLTATKNGPLHYQRAVDDKTMKMLYAVAKKLG